MAHVRCFDIIKDIIHDANKVRFKTDARLKELFEMTLAGDNNRLENAKARYQEAVAQNEATKKELEKRQKILSKANQELNEIDDKCERIRNRKNTPSGHLTEDALLKLRQELKLMFSVFKMYKDFTGVRFTFQSYPDAVVGCVIIKGSQPSKSVLRPFCIKKPYTNASSEIWSEISSAAEILKT